MWGEGMGVKEWGERGAREWDGGRSGVKEWGERVGVQGEEVEVNE